jgi:hypothetical protein
MMFSFNFIEFSGDNYWYGKAGFLALASELGCNWVYLRKGPVSTDPAFTSG